MLEKTRSGGPRLLGAAAVAGGAALYKQYRKHREGKKILADPEYRRQLAAEGNLRIPTAEDLANQSWTKRWNPLNTKESRTHDLIRAQLAHHLERHVADPHRHESQADDAQNNPLGAIVGLLGLRNKGKKRAKASDIARASRGEPRTGRRAATARSVTQRAGAWRHAGPACRESSTPLAGYAMRDR